MGWDGKSMSRGLGRRHSAVKPRNFRGSVRLGVSITATGRTASVYQV